LVLRALKEIEENVANRVFREKPVLRVPRVPRDLRGHRATSDLKVNRVFRGTSDQKVNLALSGS
jgi:hypothetical protein